MRFLSAACAWRARQRFTLDQEAVKLAPSNPTYLSNAAAARVELRRFADARDDCLRVIELQSDPQAKTYARLGKCQLAIGDFAAADVSLSRALELEPGNKSATSDLAALREVRSTLESIERDRASGGHSFVLIGLDRLDRLVARLPSSYKLWRVEALLAKKPKPDVDAALSLASDILRSDQRNADALFWRGRALWMAGSTEQAVTHWRQALTMAPDHAAAKSVATSACPAVADLRLQTGLAARQEGRGGKGRGQYRLQSRQLREGDRALRCRARAGGELRRAHIALRDAAQQPCHGQDERT